MHVHILFSFKQGLHGGGSNRFLGSLRDELRVMGAYAEELETADAVLFDSYNDALGALRAKAAHMRLPFVHRLDGPIWVYRGRDRFLDKLIHRLNAVVADATLFQSDYSRRGNTALGLEPAEPWAVVNNAVKADVFYPPEVHEPSPDGRIRLVAVSWSTHPNKGFPIYEYLDRALDFSRYTMTFVGNAPRPFSNIGMIPPQDASQLARILRRHDVFVTASRFESCPNALLEALACGLPAVAHDSGGQPELLGGGGVLFEGERDILQAVEKVAANRAAYAQAIPARSMRATASAYLGLMERVVAEGRVKHPSRLRMALAAADVRLVLGRITAEWLMRDRVFKSWRKMK